MASHTPDPAFVKLSPEVLLAVVIAGEAENQAVEGQIAVGCSIRNRTRSSRWYGGIWKDVILRWAQYSCLWEQLDAVSFRRCLEYAQDPESIAEQVEWVAQGVYRDRVGDNTNGSTHYYAEYIPQPVWAEPPAVPTNVYGVHLFFRNVD